MAEARLLARLKAVFSAFALGASLSGCAAINTIPTLEERAKSAWSEVQNQYQRRADLIPNLVETVKGFARQEREVLTAVVEARAKVTQTSVNVDPTDPDAVRRFQEAQGELGAALGRLIAITENYPDLKSNQNFLTLQAQIEGTENSILVSRRDYNEAVRQYNTTIRTFPDAIGARIFYGAKPKVPFEAARGAQDAPKVDFNVS
jgi:LemA protein